ncbi:Myb-like DNA-binding domain containing protein [Tritrichomonas foetus]|uniref:Myb-like DNA-binding domain containing protein n=1 Tax=Tritrichomonas foetus TaxID=1144522 RepID=A0A1J4KXC0_9EUKA|nr:Myb-like DNA-binding domain containing protein [Tritrichomonas foetus]|eukprot:OHT15887.1 Myb-like DNA-binding domain containing protein [Tritrichomonas foetus]
MIEVQRIVEKKTKNKWSIDEDEALREIAAEGLPWKIVSEKMNERGFKRNTKQCRDRYKNYLGNEFATDPWLEVEDKVLLLAYQKYGPRWSIISKIPIFLNRTQNQLKNRFYHSIKNRTEYLSTSIVLHKSRPKGRPTNESNAQADQHRNQTIIAFERNPPNLFIQPQVVIVIPFERI